MRTPRQIYDKHKTSLKKWIHRGVGVINFVLLALSVMGVIAINSQLLMIPSGIAMIIIFIASKSDSIQKFLEEIKNKIPESDFDRLSSLLSDTPRLERSMHMRSASTVTHTPSSTNETPHNEPHVTVMETPRAPYKVYFNAQNEVVHVEPIN